jgi:hypothetical protein
MNITERKRKQMDYVTTVRVLVTESRKPVINVQVGLFDRDENSPDDVLGIDVTNQFGEVAFRYSTRDFTDDRLGTTDDSGVKLLNRDSFPDLYVIVYNRDGEEITSTRDLTVPNKAAQYLTVYVEQRQAIEHNLILPAD